MHYLEKLGSAQYITKLKTFPMEQMFTERNCNFDARSLYPYFERYLAGNQ